jgi:hypothetical protein
MFNFLLVISDTLRVDGYQESVIVLFNLNP